MWGTFGPQIQSNMHGTGIPLSTCKSGYTLRGPKVPPKHKKGLNPVCDGITDTNQSSGMGQTKPCKTSLINSLLKNSFFVCFLFKGDNVIKVFCVFHLEVCLKTQNHTKGKFTNRYPVLCCVIVYTDPLLHEEKTWNSSYIATGTHRKIQDRILNPWKLHMTPYCRAEIDGQKLQSVKTKSDHL